MASSKILPKFHQIGSTMLRRSPWSHKAFVTAAPRPLQATAEQHAADACNKASEALKHGTSNVTQAGGDMMGKAASTADKMGQHAQGMARNASDSAQDMSSKATQKAKEAWEGAKDTMAGKGQEAKESMKQSAETVKQAMNTKN
ncbi:uncharacterized protein At4g13230-like [Macadamia integrifolia]|uniref:uncharacterized protein At4g13230-like n=1 Tax=Macadamia integrifolia TaxID=60698 RepID=UPI001C4F697F|nr:uncharacterized protein At4g13230-like [Macadamia integrifolia]